MGVMQFAKPVAVGVDGSAVSMDAVRWAAHAAALHDTDLDIIYAVEGVSAPMVEYSVPANYFDRAGAIAETVLAEARAVAESEKPDTPQVRTHIKQDSARKALLTWSEDSSLIVVGASGSGRVSSALLGSVASAVMTHAPCPAVVIRDQVLERPDTGLITVGIDGSPSSLRALEFAVDEAVLRSAALDLVSIWDSTGFDYTDTGYAAARPEIERRLGEKAEEIHAQHPDLVVGADVLEESPVDVLTKASAVSDLVVVGSRGHGGFTGLLLGSTSQKLLYHTQSPLMIVRD
ncbi:hypothetical protein GORHZ_046_01100 [Gordonia rhizosphera NBRC 16068]|uniref:UspA domain-containing protein n=2 Tax=Gordonia rhizosphera TaxID=83341 RepID=K6WQX8_9ACTN|nr:hypothetical protein GORHZ_046_01100 [Gordonia rhizosphera NBRC 16068]